MVEQLLRLMPRDFSPSSDFSLKLSEIAVLIRKVVRKDSFRLLSRGSFTQPHAGKRLSN